MKARRPCSRVLGALSSQLALVVISFIHLSVFGGTPVVEQYSIEGIVQNESGEPLPAIQVSLYPKAPGVAGRIMAITNAQGKFVVKGLLNIPYGYTTFAEGYIPALSNSAKSKRDYVMPGEKLTITLLKGGVITGRVLNLAGKPIAGASVTAAVFQTGRGTDLQRGAREYSCHADDRGIYRLFGLPDGSYKVSSTGLNFYFTINREVPTYYPSSTEATASLVDVDLGTVASGIDIIHRGETGSTISGTIEFDQLAFKAITGLDLRVQLVAKGTSTEVGNVFAISQGSREFKISSVPDGEYVARALSKGQPERGLETVGASEEVAIVVKGKDVSNVRLKMTRLGRASGIVSVEAALKQTSCPDASANPLRRIVLGAVPVKPSEGAGNSRVYTMAPSLDGQFRLYDLLNGKYDLDVQLPDPSLFVKSYKQLVDGKQISNESRFQMLSGRALEFRLVVGVGAASISGSVKKLTSGTSIFLVPDEMDQVSDSARYYQSPPEGHSFSINHIAPGKYLLLASSEFDSEQVLNDADGRSKVMSEARKSGVSIVLKPCQRVAGVKLE